MDALKGVAILLVVLGHSVQGSFVMFDSNPLFRIIYAFHMPLFMFVSGFIAFYGRDNKSWRQLSKKAAVLVLPFVAWYALSYLFTGAFHSQGVRSFFVQGLWSPDRGLWFLWVLFLNFVALAAALRLERYLKAWAIPVVWLALQLVPVNNFGVGFWKWHFTFFAAGFLIHRYWEQLATWRRPVAVMSLVLFPLLAVFWHRLTPPSFHDVLSAELMSFHAHKLLAPVTELYVYALPMLGILALWGLVSLLPLYAPNFHKLFKWLGLYTLDIYVTHQYLVRFGVGDGYLHVVTGFIVGLVGSLAISFVILRRSDVSAHILLGKPYSKRREAEAPVATPVVVPTPVTVTE